MINSIHYNRDHPLRLAFRSAADRFDLLNRVKPIILRQVDKLVDRERIYEPAALSAYARHTGVDTQVLIPPSAETVPQSHFYCPSHFSPRGTALDYQSPACAIYRIKNAIAMARTDVFFDAHQVVHPDNYDLADHICTIEQLNLGGLTDNGKFRIKASSPRRSISSGISILSGGAGNYAHLLTEVVPRLLALDKAGSCINVPLLVDGWIGRKMVDTLLFFMDRSREVIALDSMEQVRVEELHHVSSPVFAPQDYRANLSPDGVVENPRYLFSTPALSTVRSFAWEKIDRLGVRTPPARRLYVRRKPQFIDGVQYNLREVMNGGEVDLILQKHGFTPIDTTTMYIADQVAAFREAELVVAPLGAALANCIFCKPGTTVIGLAAYYNGADYSYHANLLAAAGVKYVPVLGGQYRSGPKHPMHNSYSICTHSLSSALDDVLSQGYNVSR